MRLKCFKMVNFVRYTVVVQLPRPVQLFATLWTAPCRASPSFTISWSLLKFMPIESVMLSNHLIFCFTFFCLQSFPASRSFQMNQALHFRWPKYWSFSFSNSLSNKYSRLISFRIDWFNLLAVQGTLKSLLQNHSSKASIHWHSAFFMVQLSHPYMTTGKTIVLTIGTFVSKDIALLFNTLPRFFRFSSKEQESFNFMAVVTVHSDFEAQENQICYCFDFFPFYLP